MHMRRYTHTELAVQSASTIMSHQVHPTTHASPITAPRQNNNRNSENAHRRQASGQRTHHD